LAIVGCAIYGDDIDWDMAGRLIDGYETIRALTAAERRLFAGAVRYSAARQAFERWQAADDTWEQLVALQVGDEVVSAVIDPATMACVERES
jgi:Ser/Thr protein kinase RdoA (MazF antagonist)